MQYTLKINEEELQFLSESLKYAKKMHETIAIQSKVEVIKLIGSLDQKVNKLINAANDDAN